MQQTKTQLQDVFAIKNLVYFRWSGAEVSAADVAGGAASSRRAGRSLRHGRG